MSPAVSQCSPCSSANSSPAGGVAPAGDCAPSSVAAIPAAPSNSGVALGGWHRGDRRLEELADDAEGVVALELAPAGREDPHAALRRKLRRRLEQRGLADARRSRDHHRMPVAGTRPVDERRQRSQLRLALERARSAASCRSHPRPNLPRIPGGERRSSGSLPDAKHRVLRRGSPRTRHSTISTRKQATTMRRISTIRRALAVTGLARRPVAGGRSCQHLHVGEAAGSALAGRRQDEHRGRPALPALAPGSARLDGPAAHPRRDLRQDLLGLAAAALLLRACGARRRLLHAVRGPARRRRDVAAGERARRLRRQRVRAAPVGRRVARGADARRRV